MLAHQQPSEQEEQSRWHQAAFENLHPVPTRSLHDTVRPHKHHALQRTDATTNQRRKNTALGFSLGVSALALLLLLLNLLDISPYIRTPERKTIPIQLLQLGLPGTTTGSSGNMTEEGSSVRGTPSTEPLADASPNSADNAVQNAQKALQALSKATATKPQQVAKAQPTQEFANQAFPKPVETVKTLPTSPVLSSPPQSSAKLLANAKEPTPLSTTPSESQTNNAGGNANKAKPLADASGVGTANGGDASGLGRFGSGAGKGAGYGLEWGGGGNRVVLHKEMPKYPSGVNTSVQIKIRFTVLPNGSVGAILPMQKGDPVLERAAIEALRRWQFNPLNDTKDMVGFITFTFRVQ
jgi:TonB family protein